MFKVRKIKDSYYRHNYQILKDLLTHLNVIDEYERNMINSFSNKQELQKPENKLKEPSSILMQSFNFSESPEGLEFWRKVVKDVKELQITKTL